MPRPPQPVDPEESLHHLIGATIRHWRQEVRKISLTELAKMIYIDVSQVSKWERGEIPVPAHRVADLDEALQAGRQIAALYAAVTELEELRARERVTVEDTEAAGTDETDMRRRAALQMLAALSAGAAIPPGALETVLSGVTPDSIDQMDVDRWERTVHEYRHVCLMRWTGALIPDLTADIVAVGKLLERKNPPSVHTRLLRVSAELSGRLAIELDDIGDRRAARVTWAAARRAADASGDRDLSVWVRGYEADQARWSGCPDHVVTGLADEAIALSGGKPSRGLGRAYAARASVAARQGDKHAAFDALENLAEVTDRVLEELPEYHLRWNEAYAYTFLGDGRASSSLDRALALYPPGTMTPVANLRLIQALDLVQQREINEGLEQALTVLQEGPISTTRYHLAERILGALPEQARKLPAARDLRALTVRV